MRPYILGTTLVKNDAVNDLGEREMLMFECDGTYWEQEIEIKDPDNVGWELSVPVWIDEPGANTVGEDGYLKGKGSRKVKLCLNANRGNFERTRGGIFSSPILESNGEKIDIGFELIQHAQERKTFIDDYLSDRYACNSESSVIFITGRCWSFNDFADLTFDSDVDWIKFDNIYRETEIDTPTNGKGPWMFGGNTTKMLNYWKKAAKNGDLKMVFQSFILTIDENPSNEARIGHVNICGDAFTICQDGIAEKVSDFWFNESVIELSNDYGEIKCSGDGDVPDMYISNATYEMENWLNTKEYVADDPKNQGSYKKGFHPSKGPGLIKLEAWPGENRISFLSFLDKKNNYWRQLIVVQ